ncbi:MAG: TonB-dependent receptor [Elusimicrobiales bacterium]|nr:TonB-dependent receptor [Elusimicrobiales bacterium]
MKKVLALIALTSFFPPAAAPARAAEVWAGEIVGIAARGTAVSGLSPGAVSVVLKDEIEARGAQTADQALNALPGVFNRRGKGFMDTSSALTLRGVPDQKRTLILFDGVPMNDAYTGAVAYGGLQPEDIERIEVARGPFSGLYGGGAMGGVVNFVPRRPLKREITLKGGYGGRLGPSPAMEDLVKGYLSYGDRVGSRLSFLGSFGYKRTDGYPADLNVQSAAPTAGLTGWESTTSNTGAARYIVGDKGNNGWKELSGSLRAWYDLSGSDKLSFSFSRAAYDYFYKDPATYLRDASGAEVWTYGTVKEGTFLGGDGGRRQSSFSAVYERAGDPCGLRVAFGLVDTDRSWYITPEAASATRAGGPGKIADTPAFSHNSEAQVKLPALVPANSLTVGASFRFSRAGTEERALADWLLPEEKGAVTYMSSGKNADLGLYIQDEIALHRSLTAWLSLRGDRWRTYDGMADQPGTAGYPKTYASRSDSALSPKASLVWSPAARTTLRSSAGRSFRAPAVYELYRTWTSGSVTYAGNPGLRPETVVSWDFGVDQRLWWGAKVGAVYFENRMKDLIYRYASGSDRLYSNAGRAFGKGWELEAEQLFEGGSRLYASLTLNDARIRENAASPASVGKKLTYLPDKLWSFGGELRAGRLTLSGSGRYVGKRWTTDANTDIVDGVYGSRGAHFTADARAAYKLNDTVSLSLLSQNIFDKEYYDYYPAPGRSWFAELAWKL